MSTMSPTLLAMTGVFCALVVASAAGYALGRSDVQTRTPSFVSNWNRRVRTWWLISAWGGVALLAGPAAVVASFAAVSFLALREYCSSLRSGSELHWALAASFYVLLPTQYVLIIRGQALLASVFIPCSLLILLPFWRWKYRSEPALLRSAMELGFGLLVCASGLSYPAVQLRSSGGTPIAERTAQLLFLLVISQASDVFQFLWGKTMGRFPLARRISPHKTVEGLVGGLGSTAVLGAALHALTPFSIVQAAPIALLIGLAGVIGGLLLSALKRSRGIKDWGTLLPGHGGVLDRVDSLWLSSPLFYFLTR